MREVLVIVGAFAAGVGAQLWALESTWVRPRVAAALRTDLDRLRRRGRVAAATARIRQPAEQERARGPLPEYRVLFGPPPFAIDPD